MSDDTVHNDVVLNQLLVGSRERLEVTNSGKEG